jgi:hypothetical protein
MKRQGSLARVGAPVLGALLAGLIFVLASALVLPGCAQETNRGLPPGGPGAFRGQQPAWPGVYEIMTRLDLEPEQVPSVRAVLEEAEDARDELRAEIIAGRDERPDPIRMDTMREQVNELNESTEERLSELLTTRQMEEYRETVREVQLVREAMRAQATGPHGGPDGGMGGARPGGR